MHSKISELKEKSETSSREWDAERREDTRRHEQRMDRFHRDIQPLLRPAIAKDFKRWLKGFLDNGGTPDYFRDWRNRSDTYIASESFEMIPLCGASSIDIIALEGVKITGSKGHCNIFYMDNFAHEGSVSVHADTII